MPTFNSSLWNGPNSDGSVSAGNIINDALRIAGILQRAGFGADSDQTDELLRALNRNMGLLNCQELAIYSRNIEQFPLVANQQTYTMGPGGEWDTDRPQLIEIANLVYGVGSNLTRLPMRILNDQEWSSIMIQQAASSIPLALYNNGNYPLSTIYVYFIPTVAYSVELYTWKQLTQDFTSLDDQASFPPGYIQAITLMLAVEAADMYPHYQKMNDSVRRRADAALSWVKSLNSAPNKLVTDAPSNNRGTKNWRTIFTLGPYA